MHLDLKLRQVHFHTQIQGGITAVCQLFEPKSDNLISANDSYWKRSYPNKIVFVPKRASNLFALVPCTRYPRLLPDSAYPWHIS